MTDGITNELQSSLDAWNSLPEEERLTTFQQLPYAEKDDFFLALSARDQSELILSLPAGERRIWMLYSPRFDTKHNDGVHATGVLPSATLVRSSEARFSTHASTTNRSAGASGERW